jgi:hypothetical protein
MGKVKLPEPILRRLLDDQQRAWMCRSRQDALCGPFRGERSIEHTSDYASLMAALDVMALIARRIGRELPLHACGSRMSSTIGLPRSPASLPDRYNSPPIRTLI